jgi:hypothetical protein
VLHGVSAPLAPSALNALAEQCLCRFYMDGDDWPDIDSRPQFGTLTGFADPVIHADLPDR